MTKSKRVFQPLRSRTLQTRLHLERTIKHANGHRTNAFSRFTSQANRVWMFSWEVAEQRVWGKVLSNQNAVTQIWIFYELSVWADYLTETFLNLSLQLQIGKITLK